MSNPPNFSTPGKFLKYYAQGRSLSGKWATSAAAFGTVGFMTFIYISNWRAVVKYIPFYRDQFKDEE